jgi:hypothetical protein
VAGEPYQNGFPNNPNFFPIGVWLQAPVRAPNYKAIGINTFIGLWKGPTAEQLAELAKHEMFVVAGQNDAGLSSVHRRLIKGWLQDDEPDNAQSIGLGLYGTCVPAAEVKRRSQAMKARDPTRPVMINFGQGVANPYWRGRGPCTGDQKYYDLASEGADILSFDFYPVGAKNAEVKDKLEYVEIGVENLKKRARQGQSVWAILETTALDPQHRPTPGQIRSEVWMALIHGAKGIVYFVHEFAPNFREDAIFRYPDVVSEVTRTNRLIGNLAPVLNSRSIPGKVTVTSSTPIDTMIKQYENSLYVFAIAMNNSASTARFVMEGVGSIQAEVINEGRSVAVTKGVLEDAFEGYGVHLYKITPHRY